MGWREDAKSRIAETMAYRIDNMSGMGEINYNNILIQQATDELNKTDYVMFRILEGTLTGDTFTNTQNWLTYRTKLRQIINGRPTLPHGRNSTIIPGQTSLPI